MFSESSKNPFTCERVVYICTFLRNAPLGQTECAKCRIHTKICIRVT